VLLINEKKNALLKVKQMLESLSLTVTPVSSMPKALHLLGKEPKGPGAYDPIFDLIFVEYQQVGVMLDEKRLPKIPMIIMSTFSQMHQTEILIKDKRQISAMAKPINPSGLFNAIVDAFGYREFRIERRTSVHQNIKADLKPIQGAKVLLVEDNTLNQQVADELLNQAGVSVTIAENGKIAVQLVQETRFDIVLMDIQMPVMDGLAASRKIRNLKDGFDQLPIIAMTAHAMAGDRDKSVAAGMNDHITKPIDPDKLYACLLKWIDPDSIASPGLPPQKFLDEGQSKVLDSKILKAMMPDINFDAGLKNVAGNQSLYLQLLKEFIRDYQDVAVKVKTALENKDKQTAQGTVHTVKGLSATIGAMSVHRAMKLLETAVIENSEDIEPVLENSDIEVNKIVSQILSALPQKPDQDDLEPVVVDDATLQNDIRPKLEDLKKLAAISDMASEDLFEAVKKPLGSVLPLETEKLGYAFESFDFKGASKILNQIIGIIEKRM
jgi:polar amino acid transport system substrate-binding protein